jgi:hypothetical protein
MGYNCLPEAIGSLSTCQLRLEKPAHHQFPDAGNESIEGNWLDPVCEIVELEKEGG